MMAKKKAGRWDGCSFQSSGSGDPPERVSFELRSEAGDGMSLSDIWNVSYLCDY